MICPSCRIQHHEDCKGGTWCDCQHGGTRKTIVIGGPYEPGTGQIEAGSNGAGHVEAGSSL